MGMDWRHVTEQDIENEERSCLKWIETYRNHVDELIVQINQLMETDKYDDLQKLLLNPEIHEHFSEIEAMEVMFLASIIYGAEKKNQVTPTIFEIVSSQQELQNVFQQFKFLLWHMEFQVEVQAEGEMLQYVMEQQLSVWAVRYLVSRLSTKRGKTMLVFAMHYMTNHRLVEAYQCLMDAQEELPDNEDILKTMKYILRKLEGDNNHE